MKRNKGITLIALVITIIVLLILAGVTINMLFGENGILRQAKEAKEKNIVGEEKDQIALAWNEAYLDKNTGEIEKIDATAMETNLKSNGANVKAEDLTGEILITFLDTEHIYFVDADGTLEDAGMTSDYEVDTTPGELTGEGTEEDPYKIQSIEDLVAFSYNVNKGLNTYEGKVVSLERSLFFSGALNSYADKDSKYSSETDGSTLIGYKADNSSTTSILELMTTGRGFSSVGCSGTNTFKGTFDGKNNFLGGIHIEASNGEYVGLFGSVYSDITIKNLGIKGGSISTTGYAGGLIGYINSNLTITNCYNTANITAPTSGGLVGDYWINDSATSIIIENSYNEGTISGNSYIGGLVGYLWASSSTAEITNCKNLGNVEGVNTWGGAGGILGYVNVDSIKIEKCDNRGTITNNYNYRWRWWNRWRS